MVKQTLVLIKPDGVQRSISGEIITRFENAGMKIIGMKMVWVDKTLSKEHYSEHIKKPFFKGLDEFIRSGPVIAMAMEGVDVVKNVRNFKRSDPKNCEMITMENYHYSFSNQKINTGSAWYCD